MRSQFGLCGEIVWESRVCIDTVQVIGPNRSHHYHYHDSNNNIHNNDRSDNLNHWNER